MKGRTCAISDPVTRVEPSDFGEYTPITIVETVSQRSQALVANDIGYWKRHVYFTCGVEDQSHILEPGIKGEARLIIFSRGDAVHILCHRWQKSLQHIRQRLQHASFFGKHERLTYHFEETRAEKIRGQLQTCGR